MSKLNCSNCKYYDFNACDGVDWCKLNHEETGICGYCDREFEDLEEATTHYDALVEENNTFLMENSKMAGEIKDLQSQLAITEKALELACERVKYFEELQDKEMGHFEFFGYDNEYDLQAIIEQYKQQAKEMLENE